MEKGTKSKCSSTSHHLLMDNAKNRLNVLQERFFDLQAARQEGRISDVAMLEEQVYQSLREWKAELDAPSPATSLLVCITNSPIVIVIVDSECRLYFMSCRIVL